MQIAVVLYPSVTALDFVGPVEVLSQWPGATVHYLASTPDPLRTDTGLPLTPTGTFGDVPAPDVLLVPGSSRPLTPLGDPVLVDWVRQAATTARWTTSVCTGAGVLALADVLQGREATTHWAFREALAAMGKGVTVVPERVVFAGSVVTAAGVSAGIDMALALTARELGRPAAQAIQLAIEYDPQPPFPGGSLERADAETVATARAGLLAVATEAG